MPHDDFSDRKGVSEGQNDDQLGPSHQGQPRATILAIYGWARLVTARATSDQKLIRILLEYDRLLCYISKSSDPQIFNTNLGKLSNNRPTDQIGNQALSELAYT